MTRLARKLRAARSRTGLTICQAAERMPHTSPHGLRYLEDRKIGRTPGPGTKVSAGTMTDIIRAYWPELQLADFVKDCPLKAQYEGGAR